MLKFITEAEEAAIAALHKSKKHLAGIMSLFHGTARGNQRNLGYYFSNDNEVDVSPQEADVDTHAHHTTHSSKVSSTGKKAKISNSSLAATKGAHIKRNLSEMHYALLTRALTKNNDANPDSRLTTASGFTTRLNVQKDKGADGIGGGPTV